MVMKKDGDMLSHKIESSLNNGKEVDIEVEIDSIPMALHTEYMGYNDYPKLRIRENKLIHILGQGRWGVMLSSNTGVEWQLFILPKSDMSTTSMGPLDVLDHNSKELLCARPTFTENPVEIYANIIARQCSASIKIIGNQIKILNE